MEQRVDDLEPSRFQEPLYGSPGNVHFFRRFDLAQPVMVAQAHGFELVQEYFVQGRLAQGQRARLENLVRLQEAAAAVLFAARHLLSPIVHMHIIEHVLPYVNRLDDSEKKTFFEDPELKKIKTMSAFDKGFFLFTDNPAPCPDFGIKH
jgi:hypothetical protein